MKDVTEKNLYFQGLGSITYNENLKEEEKKHCLEIVQKTFKQLEEDFKFLRNNKYLYEDYDYNNDFTIRKNNLEKLKRKIEKQDIIPKNLFNHLDWYPYIREPYLRFENLILEKNKYKDPFIRYRQMPKPYLIKEKYNIPKEKSFIEWLKDIS